MSLRQAVLAVMAMGFALLTAAVDVKFYDENLPTTLNPLYADSMVDYRAQELYFDRLYYNDPVTNNLKSRIVSKWELADAGKSVRLHLKNNLKWHSGKKLTAKDICFTIDAMLNPRTPSKIASSYREFFKKCTVESSSEAKIEFKRIFHNPTDKLKFALLPEKSLSLRPSLQTRSLALVQ
jgi:ABC-type transport system substrate-binding protein